MEGLGSVLGFEVLGGLGSVLVVWVSDLVQLGEDFGGFDFDHLMDE